jgi:hypothetical protein
MLAMKRSLNIRKTARLRRSAPLQTSLATSARHTPRILEQSKPAK